MSDPTVSPTAPATAPPPSPFSRVVCDAANGLGFVEDRIAELFTRAADLKAFVADAERLAVDIAARVKSGAKIEQDVADLVSLLPGLTSNGYVQRVCADLKAALDADLAAQKAAAPKARA